MTDAIVEFFRKVLNNDFLTVFIIALFPIIELRGSILVAFKMGMEPAFAFLISFAGSILVVPLLLLLLIPLLNFLKKFKFFRSFALAIEGIFQAKADKIANKHDDKIKRDREKNVTESGESLAISEGNKKNKYFSKSDFYKMLGVFIFVALPLPLTGVWTGSAIAVFLGLGFVKSFIPIFLGNMIAGGIMTLLSIFFSEYIDAILFWFLILVIIILILFIIKLIIKTVKVNNKNKV